MTAKTDIFHSIADNLSKQIHFDFEELNSLAEDAKSEEGNIESSGERDNFDKILEKEEEKYETKVIRKLLMI